MKSKLDDKSFDEIIREELDNLEESRPKASRTKSGRKVPGKYLTKDKAAMKGEIERVSKLKSNDPDAYGKWVADYKARNTETGKPHKTKKSAATIAYEKKFGKKNENMNYYDNTEEIESEIEMMMRPTDDKLSHDELQAIADAYGADFEDVLQIMNSYLDKREKERENDFSTAVRELFIGTDRADFTDNEKWDFWVKNGYEEEMPWINRKEFEKGIRKLLDNPNQLSLFEMKNIISEKTDVMIKNKAKASGIPASILRQVYSRGAAAWKSGHRPGVSQQQWAAGRVNSFITGSGGARKADADLWARAKKSKKRKNESVEESELRNVVRSIISEMFDEKGVGSAADLAGQDVTSLLPNSDLLIAIANDWGWDHELTEQIAYALEIKDSEERTRRLVAVLKDYDVIEDYFPYLRMNEDNSLDELYPLMVGEDNMEEGIKKYLAGAAIAAGLALGSPGKAMAQDVSKDNVNKPEIVKTLQNLKKSVFDKKIEPEPEKVSGNKIDRSKPFRIDGGTDTLSIDSLIKQAGKVTKIGDGKYQTVTRQDFSESQKSAWNFIESDLRVRAQTMMRNHLKQNVPVEAMGWPKTVVFRNPDGTYTMFAILDGSAK